MKDSSIKKFIFILGGLVIIGVVFLSGAVLEKTLRWQPLDRLTDLFLPLKQTSTSITTPTFSHESSQSVADIAEAVAPAVVTVSVKRANTLPEVQSYWQWFGQPNSPQISQPEPQEQDIGSGFVIDSSGLIITSRHVVSDTASTYLVIDKDDKEYEVKNIYRDPINDIAFLKIDAQLPALSLGDSDQLRVGQEVIAIGTALGEFRHTVTTGVISGLGRGITASDGFGSYQEALENVIQTDAAINPGNSGGPLLNASGEVIGINAAMSSSAQNIGFALPINTIKESLDNFKQTGSFSRAYLGVSYQMITEQAALMNEVPQGAYVATVIAGSPAEKAGLKQADIISKIDGQKLDDNNGLTKIIAKKKIGDELNLEVYRLSEKKTFSVTVKLEEMKQ